ncbi:MAG: hypothetical protein WBG37_13020 [Desulfobacterales bacterium]|jgi:hypothetical protein
MIEMDTDQYDTGPGRMPFKLRLAYGDHPLGHRLGIDTLKLAKCDADYFQQVSVQ